jgi:hypothetical protein
VGGAVAGVGDGVALYISAAAAVRHNAALTAVEHSGRVPQGPHPARDQGQLTAVGQGG